MQSEYLIESEEDLYRLIRKHPKTGLGSFYRDPGKKVWWVDTSEFVGLHLFSFDREKIYNLFRDYPQKLTAKEKEIFDRENPFWADFFNPRKK